LIDKYLNQLEAHLKRIDIFTDYSFSYKIDQDAGTLKIWINATFQGNSRFDGSEIAGLVELNVSPEKANSYPKRFNGHEIMGFADIVFDTDAILSGSGETSHELVSPERAASFDERFDGGDICSFVRMGCSPKIANSYNPRFGSDDIFFLASNKITPEITERYNSKWGGKEIAELFNLGCSAEESRRYNPRFDGFEVGHLVYAHISPEKADEYNQDFDGRLIRWLVEAGISPEKAEEYRPRFNNFEMEYLASAKVFPEDAHKYNSRFNGLEIAKLFGGGIYHEIANSYPERFGGTAIYILDKIGINPEQIEKNRRLADDISDVADTISQMSIDTKGLDLSSYFSFMTTGSQGVLVKGEMWGLRAYKFSQRPVDKGLIITTAFSMYLLSEPVDNIVIYSDSDACFPCRSLNHRASFPLTKIIFFKHIRIFRYFLHNIPFLFW